MTAVTMEALRARIERASSAARADAFADADDAVSDLLDALERGDVRAAERDADGRWRPVAWVKAGIMLAFRVGELVENGPRGWERVPVFRPASLLRARLHRG